MGRRFNEQFVNQGRPEPIGRGLEPVSGGIRTVVVKSENVQEQRCPLCDGKYFRKLSKIYAMPQVISGAPGYAGALSFVDVMGCACGWVMQNDKTPQVVLDHGKLRPCACGCECYEERFMVARVSRLITGTATDKIVLRQVYFCARCGSMFEAERRGAATVDEGG